MLNLESRMEILGVTVYQDSDRPDHFYHLPGPPHITVENGTPQFELYSYRKGGDRDAALTGGFLNMTVDLGIGPLFDRIKARLSDQFGTEATLSPVPFKDGSVRVVALGETNDPALAGSTDDAGVTGTDGPRFIERILGAGTPSLDGDNRAIFSFSLSEEGAAFFMEVLNGSPQARPIGVVYELDYVGLLPAYDLEVTIDFESSYEYIRDRFTLGTLLFRADIDNVVEALERREAITIKETARTLELSDPEAVRERQDRIDQLVKDLAMGALFQPSLTPGQPRVQGETITAADPTTTAPTSDQASAGSSRAANALRRGPTAAVAAGMGEALGGSRAARQGEGDQPTRQGDEAPTPQGGSSPTDGEGDTAAAQGDSRGQGPGEASGESGQPRRTAADVWNQLGRPQAAYVLKSLTQEEQRTVTYNLSQVTAQQQTIAPQNFIQFLADTRSLRRHVYAVDLNHPFFERINVGVSAAGVNFEAAGIVQMTVQLRYGRRQDGTFPKDTAEVILRDANESRDVSFFVDANRSQTYEYKLIVDYRGDFGIGLSTSRVESDWIPSEARTLVVNPEWISPLLPLTVQLAPNLSTDLAEAQVNVRYHHPETGIDDARLVRLTPAQRSATVPIRLADNEPRYEVSGTLFYTDGTTQEIPTVSIPDMGDTGAVDTVVIGSERRGSFTLDAIMLDPLGELSSVLVDTRLVHEGETLDARTLELTRAGERHVWSVRLHDRETQPQLHYRERRLYRDGGLEEESWRQATSSNLVVGIPAEGALSVAVRYIGPRPSALGLMAIIVDLEYKDPAGNPAFDQYSSLLITDDPQSFTQDWSVRLPDRQARTYSWRLTLVHADGTESRTDPESQSREQLLLRVPQL